MINLLSTKDKGQIIREYRHREVVVVASFLLGVVLVAVIIVASFYFVLLNKRRSLEAETNNSRGDTEVARFDELKQVLAEADRQVKVLLDQSKAKAFSQILEQMVALRGSGVRLGQIALKNAGGAQGNLDLVGIADTREHFLDFVHALEEAPGFVKVTYPVSTLIRDRSISFNLKIDLDYGAN